MRLTVILLSLFSLSADGLFSQEPSQSALWQRGGHLARSRIPGRRGARDSFHMPEDEAPIEDSPEVRDHIPRQSLRSFGVRSRHQNKPDHLSNRLADLRFRLLGRPADRKDPANGHSRDRFQRPFFDRRQPSSDLSRPVPTERPATDKRNTVPPITQDGAVPTGGPAIEQPSIPTVTQDRAAPTGGLATEQPSTPTVTQNRAAPTLGPATEQPSIPTVTQNRAAPTGGPATEQPSIPTVTQNRAAPTELTATGQSSAASSLSITEKIDSVRQDIIQMIAQDPENMPNWIQLAFHDCVGGCDGCLNLQHPGNKGLIETFNKAVAKHQNEHASVINLPDYIALLGTEAVREAVKHADHDDCGGQECTIDLVFSIGRKLCDNPENPAVQPLPDGDDPHSLGFLQKAFGLNVIESVALMGAHSMGQTRPENSGFHNAWDRHPLKLDVGYYEALTAPFWVPERVNHTGQSESYQWTGHDEFVSLHADMSMTIEFDVDPVTKKPSCEHWNCTEAATMNMVREFAANAPKFYEVFTSAFTKMVTTTDQDLTVVSDS